MVAQHSHFGNTGDYNPAAIPVQGPLLPPELLDAKTLPLQGVQPNDPQKRLANGQPCTVAEQWWQSTVTTGGFAGRQGLFSDLGSFVQKLLGNGFKIETSFCGSFGVGDYIVNPGNADKAMGLDFFAAEISGWRTKRLSTIMGVINRLVFVHGQERGYISEMQGFTPEGKVRYNINRVRLQRYASDPKPVLVALTGIVDYLAEYWPTACIRHTLRRWIDDLERLNLVRLHTVGGQGKQSAMWQLNVPGLLLLAEAIEQELARRWALENDDRASSAETFEEALPQHHANILRMVSEGLFVMAKRWCRTRDADADPMPEYQDNLGIVEVAKVAVQSAFELFGAPEPPPRLSRTAWSWA